MMPMTDFLLNYLVNAAWQVPALVVVAGAATWLMRGLPSTRSHLAWVLTLALAVLLPTAQYLNRGPDTPIPPVEPVASPTSLVPAETLPTTAAPAPTEDSSVTLNLRADLAGLLVIFFTGWVAFRVIRLIIAYIGTARLRSSARPFHVSPKLEEISQRCAAAFGLKRLQLLVCSQIQAPLTIGFRSPVVLLPPSLCDETTEDLLTAAIGHEAAHIMRRDYARNLVHELLLIPIAWHPAAMLITKGLRRTRELASDELVQQRLLKPVTYARCIVALAVAASRNRGPQYALGMFDGNDLQTRIRKLLSPPAPQLKRTQLVLVTSVSAVVVLAIAVSGSLFSARAQGGGAEEMKIAEAAYNQQDFRTAVQHFRSAVRMEPTNVNAKLFLANALTQAYFTDRMSPDSPLLVEARQQYLDVLAYNRNDVRALQGLLSVDMLAKRPEDARATALRLVELNPTDAGAYHLAGVTSWAMVFPEYQRIKQASGGRPEEYYVADAQTRSELRARFLGHIEFGVEKLHDALRLNPKMHESMAYLNLLYRLKSGVANTPAEAATLLAEADAWVGKAIALKRQAASMTSVASPPKVDVSGPAPTPPQAQMVMAPPPPPPPPPPGATGQPRVIGPGEPLWQVTGATEMEPMVLYRELRKKGFHALLLKTDAEPQVLVGPYTDQQALDRAKAELEAAGFKAVRIHR